MRTNRFTEYFGLSGYTRPARTVFVGAIILGAGVAIGLKAAGVPSLLVTVGIIVTVVGVLAMDGYRRQR